MIVMLNFIDLLFAHEVLSLSLLLCSVLLRVHQDIDLLFAHEYFHCLFSFVLFSSECIKTCENGGVFDPDKCFCNCSATDYIGDRCEGMCLCILSELLFICCNTFAANCGRLD